MLCPVTCSECSTPNYRDDCCLDGEPALSICEQYDEPHTGMLLPSMCESCAQPVSPVPTSGRVKSA